MMYRRRYAMICPNWGFIAYLYSIKPEEGKVTGEK